MELMFGNKEVKMKRVFLVLVVIWYCKQFISHSYEYRVTD